MLKNKLIHLLLAVLVLIAAVPSGAAAAFAAEQEQVVKVQIGAGSFDIWQHSNGEWQDTDGIPGRDEPDQDKKPTFDYTAGELLNKYTLTRVEVNHNVTPEDFNTPSNAAKDFILVLPGKGKTWNAYKDNYMQWYPNNYSAAKAKDGENLAQGRVTAQFKLNLSPQNRALDLKNPRVREELGMTDRDFSQMAQGWRWYMPVKITWYGIPKESPKNCIASAINPGVTGAATPNQKYDGTVAFKYFGDQPVQGVPVGVFNGKYQAVLKDAAGNTVTTADFNPGEKKEFNFTWTAPAEGSATLTGVINVSPLPDLFEETTKDDNKVSVTVNVVPPCTDIAISMGPDDISVVSGGQRKIYIDVKRANDGPDGPVPVRVTLSSAAGNKTWDIMLNKGETKWLEATYTLLRAESGEIGFTAQAWPQGVEDCRPGNNRASCSVYVEVPFNAPKPPDGEGIKVILIS